jgi:parallel beta-helix repeat protein
MGGSFVPHRRKKDRMPKLCLIFIVTAIVLLPAIARAGILHVPGQYSTIQVALNAALTGDTVLVAAGTYYETITWPNTQGIDLLSELGPDSTIINGSSFGVIEMLIQLDSTTVISGFLITNSFGSSGINCSDLAAPTIKGNIISDNAGDWGGGIRCYGSSPIIIENIISNNTASSITAPGGGVLCYDSSAPAIINNVITNNTANYGGGICCLEYSSPQIMGNTITGNFVYGMGGGIDCALESSPEIISNLIMDNVSYGHGGGISCHDNSSPIIRNVTITGNSADYGGGIRCMNSSPTINSCTITNNNGDGIYCSHSSSPFINDNNIMDNTGYGVHNIDPSVIINAEYNWWGDSTGPYHPITNPGGLGDSVSDYVDYDPWLYWLGVEDSPALKALNERNTIGTTIFAGSFQLTEGEKCNIYDIAGRIVMPDKMKAGIYFIEVDGAITRKVIKVR